MLGLLLLALPLLSRAASLEQAPFINVSDNYEDYCPHKNRERFEFNGRAFTLHCDSVALPAVDGHKDLAECAAACNKPSCLAAYKEKPEDGGYCQKFEMANDDGAALFIPVIDQKTITVPTTVLSTTTAISTSVTTSVSTIPTTILSTTTSISTIPTTVLSTTTSISTIPTTVLSTTTFISTSVTTSVTTIPTTVVSTTTVPTQPPPRAVPTAPFVPNCGNASEIVQVQGTNFAVYKKCYVHGIEPVVFYNQTEATYLENLAQRADLMGGFLFRRNTVVAYKWVSLVNALNSSSQMDSFLALRPVY